MPTDWAVIENGRGVLSVSTSQSQGFRALTVATRGYVRFESAALSSLGARLGSAIHIDVWVPPEVDAISPYWHGGVQLNFSIPSLAVHNDYLGQSELTPLPVGQWSTLTFTPTAQQLGKLSGSYSDLRFILAINSAATDATPYLNFRVDNLRVSDKTQSLVSVVNKDGQPISGATVVAYNGTSATNNTAVSDSTGLARVWVPVGHYRFAVTEDGATYFSAPSNHCHVPGLCVAATIVVKCHGVVCNAKDKCHSVGTCDPTNGQCSDPPLAAGTVCRPAVDSCDVAEVCTGEDAPCPEDALAPATSVCRPGVGRCDLAENCTGTSVACPEDKFADAGTLCRESAGSCDVEEVCSGTSATCPDDGFVAAGTVCRDATGLCDVAEACSGSNPTCPNDEPAPAGTVCRSKVGACDVAETCDGSNLGCPPDGKAPDGTFCSDGNACTQADFCEGGTCKSGPSIPCAAGDQCHVPGKCDTTTGICTNPEKPNGTTCNDENPITHGETCQGGTCRPPVSSLEFMCLLEGHDGKNQLSMQNGDANESWQLRGTLKLKLEAGYATLLKASLEGFGTPNVANNNVFLMRGIGKGPGTFDEQTGAINVVLPFLFVRPDQPESALKVHLTGTLSNGVLTGTADSVPGSTPAAHIDVLCQEQFLDAFIAVDYEFDEAGNVSFGDAHVGNGSPSVPALRDGLATGDVLFETRREAGEVLDQFVVKKPASMGGEPVVGVTFSLAVPLSNGIHTILARDAGGEVVAQKELSGDIATFCAGQGSQLCDVGAGRPVRKVFFAPNAPPPGLGFPSPVGGSTKVVVPLPSSSRVLHDELTVDSTTDDDRQPSVALDADGNAVVAWRRGYKDIMVAGIATDNSVEFGPIVANDKFCAESWLPKEPPSSPPMKERATPYTSRPLVARVVGRNSDGSADGTFVVAWGGLLRVAELAPPPDTVDPGVVAVPIICARFFKSNGSPLTDPILVAPKSSAHAENLGTYFSIAMASSHEAVVAWHGPSSNTYRTYARMIDSEQNSQPAAITVGSDSSSDSVYPTVAVDKDGRTVIAWLETSSLASGPNGMSGTLMLQRLNSDFSKRGSVVSGGAMAGIPSVAWSSSSNTFLVAGRKGTGEIWASTYAFETGDQKGDSFKANARWNGRQHRPIVVSGAKGEFTVAWMDDVTIGSSTGSVVTAQVFRKDFVPQDIDFTISTKRPIDVENVPDLWDMDGFGFSAGGSGGDNMAFVWQTADGIAFQRVSGGAYTCPEPDDCKTAVPWRITGPTKDKLNVLLGPGNTFNPSGTPSGVSFSGELEFSRMAVEGVVNGLFVNGVIRQNAGKINFFRGTEDGRAEDNDVCKTSSPYSDYWFLEVMGVLMKGEIQNAPIPDGCTPGRKKRFGMITQGLWDAKVMSMLVHEFSHSAFQLSDEYDCGGVDVTHRDELLAPALPNLYESMASCESRSSHPSDCRALTECVETGKSWYRADRDEPIPDVMGEGSLVFQYKEDCERNPKRIFESKN